MDPLTAFGLAANILQLVDFGSRLLSTGREISQTGSTLENAEIEQVVLAFQKLNEDLQESLRVTPGITSKIDQVSIP